jgi:hypothetical protein
MPAKRTPKRRTPSKRRPAAAKKRYDPVVVKFVPIERAFKAQIKVRALLDVNGWLSRERGIKFEIPKGKVGFIDADTARVWQAKGYIQILEGEVKPVSPDELAELTKNDASISLGEAHG